MGELKPAVWVTVHTSKFVHTRLLEFADTTPSAETIQLSTGFAGFALNRLADDQYRAHSYWDGDNLELDYSAITHARRAIALLHRADL